MLTERELNEIRARFRVFQQRIYLNSCSQGALADVVEAGVMAYLTSWRERGSPWDMWTEQYERARKQFAAFIGAQPDEVAIVSSVSAGINAVASALDFHPRFKIVMGEFEFPTMGHIWLAQQRRGARVEFIAARDGRIPVDAYARAIDETTRLVPVTHVSFLNGVRADVKAIARLAHERGAWVMMDDYQDCGTRPIDVKALDVDFYLTGTLKYLLGPPGLAFLYVRAELIPSLQPTISGWFAQRDPFAFDVRRFDPSPTARRFQAGTPPIPNLYAAMPALDLLSEIGLDRIAAHIEWLSRALIDRARALGIRLKTPTDSVGPLIVLQSKDLRAILARLAERRIVASGRHDGLRLSLHVYNTLDDVEAAVAVLEENLDLMVREGDD